ITLVSVSRAVEVIRAAASAQKKRRRVARPEAVDINLADAAPPTSKGKTNYVELSDFTSIVDVVLQSIEENGDRPSTSAAAVPAQKTRRRGASPEVVSINLADAAPPTSKGKTNYVELSDFTSIVDVVLQSIEENDDRPSTFGAAESAQKKRRRGASPEVVSINLADAAPPTSKGKTNYVELSDFTSIVDVVLQSIEENDDRPSTFAAAESAQKKRRRGASPEAVGINLADAASGPEAVENTREKLESS
uniref:Uncharacterized protein n=1 Tax=Glossina palpalis gambiensis TaxID=67801 RepID=A0A1B0BLK7_9MUSC